MGRGESAALFLALVLTHFTHFPAAESDPTVVEVGWRRGAGMGMALLN